MNKIIERDEIKNFWIVYLMPFDKSERENKFIKEYQENCIKKNIFGMGWHGDSEEFRKNYENKYTNEILNDNIAKEYKNDYESSHNNTISLKCLKNFSEIQKNDIVIMRLKNAHYYIGIVNDNGTRYCDGKDIIEGNKNYLNKPRLSWYCSVKNWYEFPEYKLPQDIVGRFSQKLHSTIDRIGDGKDNARIKHFLYNLYKQKESLDEDFEFPKIELNRENFTDALNYKDLEDLVYLYILEQEKEHNYILLPSECKVNKMKYEFNLIEKYSKEKIITCQVKNRAIVDYLNYIEDSRIYHKIYLFSGINEYSENKIDEGKAINLIKNDHLNHIIKIIEREKLYQFFIHNHFLWNKTSLNQFYRR